MKVAGQIADISEAISGETEKAIKVLTPLVICDPVKNVRDAGISALLAQPWIGPWKVRGGRMADGQLMLKLSEDDKTFVWAIVDEAPKEYQNKPATYHPFEVE
ncbi:MAG: hypothetical protein QF486_03880 [Candidatus Woesearchaeota archaeon]|jgi:hypothetical protein|nr:hypothetical protein [Candidatus Woesearchaeota archaeon]MDP7181647.1 hypothetical protein [Candidatus Woesearchaeota archaeon]MDP7198736.1 hypothetical protein [Candidatus Woesearchaeota archaeon]MDP7467264.1 hypothetical protein [Candidatus Woesearchaeota archaeon]MDP7647401.1 hypothetical protein [Candidatus Woesearchaeota archaeon]